MAADLAIPFQLICSFEQIISFENSVHSVFLAYFGHSTLKFLFFLQRTVVGKHIELVHSVILSGVVCADTKPAEEQSVIRFLIEFGKNAS